MARKTGQIIRRGPATWLVRIYVGFDREAHKHVYISKQVHGGLRKAQAELNRLLTERDLGRNIRSARQTLDRYLSHWLEVCVRPAVRALTHRDYASLLTRYVRPRLGDRMMDELAAAELQSLYSELLHRNLSARTIRYVHSILHSAFNQAVRWKVLLENPAK